MPVIETAAVTVSAPFGAMVDESEHVPARWLAPWDDGFLAVGVRYPPRPLPDELPPEIAGLFPPEVVALFPDGLPPDQQQATDVLTEAGLLDVVMDVLNEHPEAMDAVASMPVPDPEVLASWSTDGDTWTPTELSLPGPIGEVGQVTVAGDRLTIAGTQPVGDDDAWIVTVSSTTDLRDWDTVSFPVAEAGGTAAQYWVTPIAVAADDEHWVARVMVNASNELWSGAWDGDPTMSDARPTSQALLATSEGFLDLGPGVAFSPDGTTWTEAPEPAGDYRIQAAAPLDDDVLAIAQTGDGSRPILLLDATGAIITELDAPELDGGFSVWSQVSSPAVIVMPVLSGSGEQPVPWLLATTDAQTWLVEELEHFEPNLWRAPDVAAANGTTVLVAMYGSEPEADVWQRFTMPG